jgi:hypothetical protein
MEEAGSGHEDSSHNILTLDALQVLSGPRLELSMSMRIRPICKSLHTYICAEFYSNRHTQLASWRQVARCLAHTENSCRQPGNSATCAALPLT